MDTSKIPTLELVRFASENAEIWDETVNRSRNGTFLFERGYMDYHADRFHDNSFMVIRKNRMEAVIPGNRSGSVFYTHQGLTYGGVISSDTFSTTDMIEVFKLLNDLLRQEGFTTVIYKPVPSIYHKLPAEEELYALFRNNAKLVARQISSAILQGQKMPFNESRKSGIRKAVRCGVEVQESEDYAPFWNILNDVLLTRHGTKPVHSLAEITLLHQRFPKNIRLHLGIMSGNIVAGVVIYLTERVAHVQYIAANEEGKKSGALDLIFDQLINHIYTCVPVFEFGVSTEQGGCVLNEHLIFQKEGFGGRGIIYDTYEYAL